MLGRILVDSVDQLAVATLQTRGVGHAASRLLLLGVRDVLSQQ